MVGAALRLACAALQLIGTLPYLPYNALQMTGAALRLTGAALQLIGTTIIYDIPSLRR